MKVSIIIPILDSHELTARQIKHFELMDLTDDIEIIFMDDGSDPPLSFPNTKLKNFTIFPTNDFRPWTQELARNKGAELAKGEFLFMTDIDHILTKEAIEAARDYEGDKMVFPRYFGILNKDGIIETHQPREYGWRMRGPSAGLHSNTFSIRKEIFFRLGGYSPRYCSTGKYISQAEKIFNNRWYKSCMAGTFKEQKVGPIIHFYPAGRYHITGERNPLGIFHNLSYD
jgi:hypothetical protein